MAEWQTHKTQNLAGATSCGFKSHHPHYNKKNSGLCLSSFCYNKESYVNHDSSPLAFHYQLLNDFEKFTCIFSALFLSGIYFLIFTCKFPSSSQSLIQVLNIHMQISIIFFHQKFNFRLLHEIVLFFLHQKIIF